MTNLQQKVSHELVSRKQESMCLFKDIEICKTSLWAWGFVLPNSIGHAEVFQPNLQWLFVYSFVCSFKANT